MTPLANRIVRELTLPPKRRTFVDAGNITSHMRDVRCFDCSEVVGLAQELIEGGFAWATDRFFEAAEQTSFLPAPRTWIEWKAPDGRVALLLLQRTDDAEMADILIAFDGQSLDGGIGLPLGKATQHWGNSTQVWGFVAKKAAADREWMASICVRAHVFLALINSPRIVGRREHEPNVMLAKRLEGERRAIGVYKLNTWSEIKLHVTDPEASGDGPAHMTGEKALHFCRSHLRIRLGRLERVKAHWRGNPEVGVRQGRYTVMP